MTLAVPTINYKVVHKYPHDRTAYTEGLKFYDSLLYESTGGKGVNQSTLRRVDMNTGVSLEVVLVNDNYFAEGLTIIDGKLFQLTLDSGLGLIYDVRNLNKPALEFRYNGWAKGWGLTDDGKNLILSDGSDQLYFIDPLTTQLIGQPISVQANGTTVQSLNELEYVEGLVYANILYSDLILRINPVNGDVLGQIDLRPLRPRETTSCVDCVLNGIAYDEKTGHMLITGKMWPDLFSIWLLN
jgi:glutaminyl-peptide cyclotransferase